MSYNVTSHHVPHFLRGHNFIIWYDRVSYRSNILYFFFFSFSVALVFTVSDRKYYQKQLALIEAYEDLERLQHEDARDQTKLDDEAMTTLRLSQLSFFANFVRIFLTPDLFPTVFKLSIFILHD